MKAINFLKQHKPLLLAAIFTFAVMLAMLWIAYDDLRIAADKTQHEAITEVSDAVTENLQNGISVIQPFSTNNEIHGMVMQVSTFQKIVLGTLNLRLLAEDKTVLATASHNMGPIRDSELFSVVFDKAAPARQNGKYYLEITANYDEGEEDFVALWQEENAQSGLSINGKAVPGLLHLDIITNRSATFIKGIYLTLCLIILAALVICAFLIFEVKLSLYKIFFAACLLCGLMYMLIIPPHWAPDEEVHATTAYRYSNILLGLKQEQGVVTMRECDIGATSRLEKPDVFSYQKLGTLLGTADSESPYAVASQKRFAQGFNASYLPSCAGLTLARVLGFNYITMVLFGRLFNLLCFAVIGALAIKLAPFAKNIFFAVGMLPMSISLAASFSYDALLIAFSMLFIALVLKCAYGTEPLSYKTLIALCASAAFLAPNKGIYVFICGLCLIIPSSRFNAKKIAVIFKCSILTVALITFAFTNMASIQHYLGLMNINEEKLQTAEGLQAQQAAPTAIQKTEINEKGEEIVDEFVDYVERYFYDPAYVLTHLRDSAKLTINTVQESSLYYAKQMVGGYLSEPILVSIEINGIFVALLYAMLLCSTLRTHGESSLKPKHKLACLLIISCVLAVLYIVVLSWTPIHHEVMWGMQGRYLLPLLPLTLLLVSQKTVVLQRDITRPLCFAAVWLNSVVALNGFAMFAVQ